METVLQMPPTRPRRIVRRAMMAIAGVVLLLAWYVGAWLLLPQVAGLGWIDWTTVDVLEETVFAPISIYSSQEWPGSAWLESAWDQVNSGGVVTE